MKELEPAEKSFLQGDEFFTDEHLQWETLKQKLLSQGYSLEEVEALRKHYKEEYSKACAKERAVFKELNIGKSIWKSLIPDSVSDGKRCTVQQRDNTRQERTARTLGCFFLVVRRHIWKKTENRLVQ